MQKEEHVLQTPTVCILFHAFMPVALNMLACDIENNVPEEPDGGRGFRLTPNMSTSDLEIRVPGEPEPDGGGGAMGELLRLLILEEQRPIDLTDSPPPRPPTPPPPIDHSALLTTAFERTFGIGLKKSKLSGQDLMALQISYPHNTMKAFQDGSVNPADLLPSSNSRSSNSRSTVSMTVTVGVVVHKEASKLTTKDRLVFGKVSLGTPLDGAAIDVLFFGSCYAAYFNACVLGKVIAIVKPKILEAQTVTRTTFAVYDKSQVQVLGDSKDFGTCPYAIDTKLDAELGRRALKCEKIFDKRSGTFCPYCLSISTEIMTVRGADSKRMRDPRSSVVQHRSGGNKRSKRQSQKRTKSTVAPVLSNFAMQPVLNQMLSFKVGNSLFARPPDMRLANNKILFPRGLPVPMYGNKKIVNNCYNYT
jgi:hypothetical protein